jgi:RNA polymerase sigma-70 factor (ECF subfamily)
MESDLVSYLEPLHQDAFAWARHCCGEEGGEEGGEAADVLQNAYLNVIEGRTSYSGKAALKTWWFGVIRFTAKEEQRRRRGREFLVLRWRQLDPGENDGRSKHTSIAEREEEASQLRAALGQLPARQAEVLHLVFYQDLSLSEAALVMRVSIGSTRTHYERGKARLRSLLAPPQE